MIEQPLEMGLSSSIYSSPSGPLSTQLRKAALKKVQGKPHGVSSTHPFTLPTFLQKPGLSLDVGSKGSPCCTQGPFLVGVPCGMRDLGSLLGSDSIAPAMEAQSLNHQTTTEVPQGSFLLSSSSEYSQQLF